MIEIVMALVVLGLVVTALSALVFWKRRKAGVEQEINYYAFFILGICFLPFGAVGMATKNYGLMGITGLGIVYIGIGLAHRDKWPQNKKDMGKAAEKSTPKYSTGIKKDTKKRASSKKKASRK